MTTVKCDKIRCIDCGAMWFEGKSKDGTPLFLISIKDNKKQYVCLDENIVSHYSVTNVDKTVSCCPACESSVWELREQRKSLIAITRQQKKKKKVIYRYIFFLINRLLYGEQIVINRDRNNLPTYSLKFDSDSTYSLIQHMNSDVLEDNTKVINRLQAISWIKNYVNDLAIENYNEVERRINEISLLEKYVDEGEEK